MIREIRVDYPTPEVAELVRALETVMLNHGCHAVHSAFELKAAARFVERNDAQTFLWRSTYVSCCVALCLVHLLVSRFWAPRPKPDTSRKRGKGLELYLQLSLVQNAECVLLPHEFISGTALYYKLKLNLKSAQSHAVGVCLLPTRPPVPLNIKDGLLDGLLWALTRRRKQQRPDGDRPLLVVQRHLARLQQTVP